MNAKEFGKNNGIGLKALVQIPYIEITDLMKVPTLTWFILSLN